jgi:hypothetical protein
MKRIFDLVECLMGLAGFLHQHVAEGGTDLAVQVPFDDGLLNAKEDQFIRVNVLDDSVGVSIGNLPEDAVTGGDREKNRGKVDWR